MMNPKRSPKKWFKDLFLRRSWIQHEINESFQRGYNQRQQILLQLDKASLLGYEVAKKDCIVILHECFSDTVYKKVFKKVNNLKLNLDHTESENNEG